MQKSRSDVVADDFSVESLAPPFKGRVVSEGNTTAQTFDDSFTEVVSRKNRRE